MADSVKLHEELMNIVHNARSIHEGAKDGKLSSEEQIVYDRHMADYDKKKTEYDQARRLEEAEAFVGGAAERSADGNSRLATDQPDTRSADAKAQDEYNKRALEVELNGQTLRYAPGTPEHASSSPDAQEMFRAYLRGDTEYRALSTGSAHTFNGSSLKAPAQFVAEVIKEIANMNVIRRISRVVPWNDGESLEWPKRSAAVNNFAFRDESTTAITDDTQLAYGNVTLNANRLDGVVAVSNRLMRIGGGVNVEAVVREESAEGIADAEEAKFMTGTGASNQPLGVFYGSASGIPTSQDIDTGNTTTAIGIQNLFEVFHAVKAGHRRRGSWVLPDASVKAIRLLKDTTNQYLWQPGLQAGQPDTIFGRPVYTADQAPATFTTGLYVGIFGDFSHYVIRDSLSMELQRLTDSAYAKKNQTGFLVRREVDAKPVLGTAFARMTLA